MDIYKVYLTSQAGMVPIGLQAAASNFQTALEDDGYSLVPDRTVEVRQEPAKSTCGVHEAYVVRRSHIERETREATASVSELALALRPA